ncbi:threonylcarbamoyl-AMP synthase [Candidatus Berkelbacteria bacterium]|nr:threonylcarbamoyl-AMP synthase [Candidatus Berkelbacteria bacterium]
MMKILTLSPQKPDSSAIQAAVEVLKRGGVLIYPTDTCYGLGTDARNRRAIQRLLALKDRETGKKFSVIAQDLEHIERLAQLSDYQRETLKRYLPGSYTFILLNADFGISPTNTIGIRIPDYPITQVISQTFHDAYITTSANLSGQGALYSLEDIKKHFLHVVPQESQPDLILNAGALPQVPSSTVVDLTTTPPTLIRQGNAHFTPI